MHACFEQVPYAEWLSGIARYTGFTRGGNALASERCNFREFRDRSVWGGPVAVFDGVYFFSHGALLLSVKPPPLR
jgi:hypothetical protein